jgi:hypothetical protein
MQVSLGTRQRRASERIGHCLAGGDEIPGGNEKWIPAGDGDPFSHRGEQDPRQAGIAWGSGRDTNIGTGFVSRGAGCASRGRGKRDGTRCFTGKTSGIRAERNGTGSNWNAKRRQAQPAPRIKTPISPRVTKTLRKTELKSVISLCLGAFVVKSLPDLAGRDTLFHRANPGELAGSIERGGSAIPQGPKLDRPVPAVRSACGGDPFSHKGKTDPHQHRRLSLSRGARASKLAECRLRPRPNRVLRRSISSAATP